MKVVKRSFFTLLSIFLLSPAIVLAAAGDTSIDKVPKGTLTQYGIVALIERVVSFLIYVSGAIALIFVVIAGLRYIFSGGDSEKAQKARGMIWNGLIGLVIIIAAFIVVQTVTALAQTWLK